MYFASYSILFFNQGLYLVVGLRALFAIFIKKGVVNNLDNYTCVQARLYTELRIQKPFDSFYPAFETLSVRLSLKSGNQSNFPMSSD